MARRGSIPYYVDLRQSESQKLNRDSNRSRPVTIPPRLLARTRRLQSTALSNDNPPTPACLRRRMLLNSDVRGRGRNSVASKIPT